MKLIQILATIMLTASYGNLHASALLIDQVRHEFKNELYPISKVIPGYQRPANIVPGLAVAEFRIVDNELHAWSQAISETLRYKIQYTPKVRLYMPSPYFTHIDAQLDDGPSRPLLTARNHFRNLNQSLGIETVLTGSVSKTENQFHLTTELLDAVSGNEIFRTDWQFTGEELPDTLMSITEWVYLSLGVQLSENELAYVRDESTLSQTALQSFVQEYANIISLEPPLKRDLIHILHAKHPEFALLAAYAATNRTPAQNLDEAYKKIALNERLRERHSPNAGIELDTYKMLDIGVMPKYEVAATIRNMQRLVVENSHDPSILIELGSALLANGSSIDGIAVMLEAVERWPDNYRTWWTLGWAINRHAWQVRGNSFWRDVPENAKVQFKSLTPLANQIIDRALSLNSHNPRLWNMKINSVGSINGYSDEILTIFDKAVKTGPELEKIYSSALNYSSQNWKGNAKARRYIIETAEKNNPGAPWPKRMRNRHADDFGRPYVNKTINKYERYFWGFYDHPDFWLYASVGGFCLLWIVYSIGKWTGRREVEFEYYPEDEEDEPNDAPNTAERYSSESHFR